MDRLFHEVWFRRDPNKKQVIGPALYHAKIGSEMYCHIKPEQ